MSLGNTITQDLQLEKKISWIIQAQVNPAQCHCLLTTRKVERQ